MTAASLSPAGIVDLLDAFPDYALYSDPDRAQDHESPFRLALGRVAKTWGDQLLDAAEYKPNPLSRSQVGMIDNLLQGIGEIFRELNATGHIDPALFDRETFLSLSKCDGTLLDGMEATQRRANHLQRPEFAGLWIDEHAKPMLAALARLEKVLAERNEVLGIREDSEEAVLSRGSFLGELM